MIGKEIIKNKILKSQNELNGHIENMFRLFDNNIRSGSPNSLLDIGCGKGERTIRIAKYFNIDENNTYGVDWDNQHISACRKTFNASLIDLESDKLPFQNNKMIYLMTIHKL